jgi:hypothetical protein
MEGTIYLPPPKVNHSPPNEQARDETVFGRTISFDFRSVWLAEGCSVMERERARTERAGLPKEPKNYSLFPAL